MPIIIDANRAGDFSPPHAAHATEIANRIAKRRMSIVIGGRLLRELSQTKLIGLVSEWIRAGCAKRLDDAAVDSEECRISSCPIASDDPHVLALALLSGCRLVYTEDQNLIKDFKNLDFLRPKGKVVKPSTNTNGP